MLLLFKNEFNFYLVDYMVVTLDPSLIVFCWGSDGFPNRSSCRIWWWSSLDCGSVGYSWYRIQGTKLDVKLILLQVFLSKKGKEDSVFSLFFYCELGSADRTGPLFRDLWLFLYLCSANTTLRHRHLLVWRAPPLFEGVFTSKEAAVLQKVFPIPFYKVICIQN